MNKLARHDVAQTTSTQKACKDIIRGIVMRVRVRVRVRVRDAMI
jgi:hypothetical protein